MHRILSARTIAPNVTRFRVEAPRVAAHWQPGQFVIVRPTPNSERIPLTIVEGDAAAGWIGLIVQAVGKTTTDLDRLGSGESIADIAGPLGTPSPISRYGTVAAVGGGVGTAIVYPVAAALAAAGNRVIAIVGARSSDLLILCDELAEAGAEVHVATDDGSAGTHGVVTDVLTGLMDGGTDIDRVFAAGPVVMMQSVAAATREHGIPTIASLNPIMVDGTGMCGGCRVSVGGETKFACVDGPEFDAHLVDFALLATRNRAYAGFEEARRSACRAEPVP